MAGLSVRYAEAFFALCLEDGVHGECREQAAVARDILQTEDCQAIMKHPHISAVEKRAFIYSAFAGQLMEPLDGFLRLLVAKGREHIMASALTAFIGRVDSHNGKTDAHVVSAVALSDGQVSALRQLLQKKLGKQVNLTVDVEPGLIGGMYIQADGYYANHTIKEKLVRMKKSIIAKEGIL